MIVDFSKQTAGLVHHLVELEDKQAVKEAKRLLKEGVPPMLIIQTCRDSLMEVGNRYERGVYFLSGLMMAGEILHSITEILSPYIKQNIDDLSTGRILIGTVQGDIHDIGKNLVIMLLRCRGFEVMDLGVDVSPSEFVLQSRQFRPHIVALSCFLDTTVDAAWETLHLIKERSGLPLGGYKTIIGGAFMNQEVCDYVGADAWATNAVVGVRFCDDVMRSLHPI